MTALGDRNRGPKKPSSNPYAERGLDKFAILSAELEAERERLVAQLGSPFSLVRFESASDDSKWIPIIVCPTLSKAEIEAATHLNTANKPASSGKAHEVRSSGTLISGENTHSSSLTGNEKEDSLAHAGDVKIGRMPGFIAALQRFLWIAAFSLSIVADVVCDLIMRKWHVETVPKWPSHRSNGPKEENFTKTNLPAAMAPSTDLSPLPPPAQILASMPREGIEAINPPRVEAPKTYHGWKAAEFSTAPRKPRDSRQNTKRFLTSVSLPKTFRMQDQAPHMGITKDSRLLKSVSLPKASQLQKPNSHKALRSSTSTSTVRGKVSNKERNERSEKLGQALTGAGLVLGLCCLEMGYILAIASFVCLWYALPSLRKGGRGQVLCQNPSSINGYPAGQK